MNDHEIRIALETERLTLCDTLETFTDADWATPSLCAGWTTKDVIAHLTLTTRWRMRDLLVRAVRARGSFDRMELHWARDRASAYRPAELVDQLRGTAGLDRRMVGSKPMDPLYDILVHGQDIVRPLGRTRPMPVDVAVAALTFVVANTFHGAVPRVAGLGLATTDADWSYGEGDSEGEEVSGPVTDLLLAVAGRPAGLAGLTGSGVDTLRQRLVV